MSVFMGETGAQERNGVLEYGSTGPKRITPPLQYSNLLPWSESREHNEAGGPLSSVLYEAHLAAPVFGILEKVDDLTAG
jgi:hypothetical protein